MPPKAANESSVVKPETGIVTYHRERATRVYFSRGAGFEFLSFVQKLRKEKRKS